MNSTENIQEGYRNGLSKTALAFEICKQQLFTLTMCLPACLWAQIARTPFDYTITAWTLLAKFKDYQFQRLILQFPTVRKNYRITSMFIVTRALSTPRDFERWESDSMFCERNHFLKFERIEYKAWKQSAEKYHDQTMKFTPPAVGLTPFNPWVSLHHTFALGNLILRCLAGSHMIIIHTIYTHNTDKIKILRQT